VFATEPTTGLFCGGPRFNIFDAGGGDMGRVYRTLLLKYPLEKLQPEAVVQMLKVQQEFHRWAEQWARSNGKTPLPREEPLRRLAVGFVQAASALGWLRERVFKRGLKPPLAFEARLGGGKDAGGVVVDLRRRVVEIGEWGALPLSEYAVIRIRKRVKEGAELVYAAAWVGESRRGAALYVALAFRRKAEPIRPRRLLVVGLNAQRDGVAYAVVEEERVLERSVLRPDVDKIRHLRKVISRLEAACARKKNPRVCQRAASTKSSLLRRRRLWEDEAAEKIVRLALQYKAAIVVDASDVSEYFDFGRLKRRVKGLAGWHGVPYREERLYSAVCPNCGGETEEAPDGRVKCQCGFSAHRDEVPIAWAQKRFKELILSFSPDAPESV